MSAKGPNTFLKPVMKSGEKSISNNLTLCTKQDSLMVDMYVLVNCDLGRTEEIASELRKTNQVQETHIVSGLYDIIVKLSGPSTRNLEYVYFKIRHIDGIISTLTLSRIY